jgi:hypothetical protein
MAEFTHEVDLMELIFNELSAHYLTDSAYEAKQRMRDLLLVCQTGLENGFSQIRVDRKFDTYFLATNYTVLDWLNDNSVSSTQKSLFLSYRLFPYIEESDESAENTFIEKSFYLNEADEPRFNGFELEGLAVAYIYDTIAVSFPANKVWQKLYIKLLERCNENEQLVEVKHVSLAKHFETHKNFIEANQEIVLQATPLKPNEKVIHLRDDHGKDILMNFANRLINSSYVTEIINSLPFNPRDGNFEKFIPMEKLK